MLLFEVVAFMEALAQLIARPLMLALKQDVAAYAQ